MGEFAPLVPVPLQQEIAVFPQGFVRLLEIRVLTQNQPPQSVHIPWAGPVITAAPADKAGGKLKIKSWRPLIELLFPQENAPAHIPKSGFILCKAGVPIDPGDGTAHFGLGDQTVVQLPDPGLQFQNQLTHRQKHQPVVVLPMLPEPFLAVPQFVFHQKIQRFPGKSHCFSSFDNIL